MKQTWTTVALILALVLPLQVGATWTPKVPEEMQQLGFLAGQWEGTGWAEGWLDGRSSFDVVLDVKPLLGGAVLVLQIHASSDMEGEYSGPISYVALRIINYDRWSKCYRVRSFTPDGQSIDWESEAGAGVLTCWFDDVRAGTTRFALHISEDGVLHELGDSKPAMSLGDEESWDQCYGLTLKERVTPELGDSPIEQGN